MHMLLVSMQSGGVSATDRQSWSQVNRCCSHTQLTGTRAQLDVEVPATAGIGRRDVLVQIATAAILTPLVTPASVLASTVSTGATVRTSHLPNRQAHAHALPYSGTG